MAPIDVAGFERQFQKNIDPWNYRTSDFECRKRRILIQACGIAKYGRGLELGCANGETTRKLARLCLRLTAVDGSATAIEEAQRRIQTSTVRLIRCVLPRRMPHGPFDLIVISELAYYLAPHDLATLEQRLFSALAPGGRIVILNHLKHFNDAAQHAAVAHQTLCFFLKTKLRRVYHASYPRFAVAAFEQHTHRT